MFVGIAGLEKMILAFCIGDRILGDIIHWEVDVLNFFSERENVVVRGIEIRNGVEGIKVGEEKDRTVKVGCWFELNKKLIGARIGVSADILERMNAQFK